MLGNSHTANLGVRSRHYVSNCLAVLAGATAAGADVAQTCWRLGDLQISPGKGNIYNLQQASSELPVIVMDSTRNIEFASLSANLAALHEARLTEGMSRILLAIGEVPDVPADAYESLPKILDLGRPSALFTCSDLIIRHAIDALPSGALHKCSGIDELVDQLTSQIKPGDAILVQGTRRARYDRIVRHLVGTKRYRAWDA